MKQDKRTDFLSDELSEDYRDKIAVSELNKLMKPYGFMHKKKTFLRLTGNGVLQSIFVTRERSGFGGNIDFIACAMQSIYKKDVFGEDPLTVKLLNGRLTEPFYLVDIYNLSRNPGERRSRADTYSVDEQLQMLQDSCLPVLTSVETQEGLCSMLQMLSNLSGGSWTHEAQALPALLFDRRYEEAANLCKSTLKHNSKLKEFQFILNSLEQQAYDAIDRYLVSNKMDNLAKMEQLFGK